MAWLCLFIGMSLICCLVFVHSYTSIGLFSDSPQLHDSLVVVTHDVAEPAGVRNFMTQYRRFAPLCSRDLNRILPRYDDIGTDQLVNRPWSLHANTYNHTLPLCTNTNDLLASLRRGVRVSTSSNSSFGSFTGTSVFAPHGCSYHWFSADEACSALSRFSRVYYVGDSLVRHTAQALIGILSGDWRFGALPRLSGAQGLTANCNCDGQFSESRVCRTYSTSLFDMPDPHDYGICPTLLSVFRFVYHSTLGDEAPQPWNQRRCDASEFNDDRPLLVVYSVGYHIGLIAERLVHPDGELAVILNSIYVDPQASEPCAHSRAPARVQFALVGVPRQAALLDDKYTNQRPEFVDLFNLKIAQFVDAFTAKHKLPSIPVFDVAPLSLNAASSDGLHTLQDSNMIRNQYVLNWITLHNNNASFHYNDFTTKNIH